MREFYSIKTQTCKLFDQFYISPAAMEFYLGSQKSNAKCNSFSKQARLDQAISECECVVSLHNHLSNECRCNIFRGMICHVHHTLRCIQLYSENRHAAREHSDTFWLMEARKN